MENQGQELVEAKNYMESKVKLAEALQRLQANPDWQLVIDTHFIKDWALTQINNVGAYNQDQRRGYLEQAMARGIFNQEMYDIIEDGRMAKDALNEINQDLKG
jgi:hypothetical protein